MKRRYPVLFGILMVVLVVGCKSNQLQKDRDIPDWVAKPPTDSSYIYGIGISVLASEPQAIGQADTRARADIATKLSTAVDQMITDYSRTAGTETSQAATLAFYEVIDRQLASTTLSGVEVVERDRSRDGKTYYTLMRISKADAIRQTNDLIQIQSEESRYAEFKAMEAMKLMDQYLDGR